jgi:hypothetical protein
MGNCSTARGPRNGRKEDLEKTVSACVLGGKGGYTCFVTNQRPPTDTRADRRRLDRNLAWAVVIFLVGVGGIAIGLAYGRAAVFLGVTCLGAGAFIFGLLWLILTLMEKWAGR